MTRHAQSSAADVSTGSAAMYQAVILEHFRHPSHKGAITKPDAHARDINTSCGDELSFSLSIGGDGMIDDVKFEGSGCAISQAAADMLADRLKGMKVNQALALDKDEALRMLGVPISGARLKCALLGLKVAKMALIQHECKKQPACSKACERDAKEKCGTHSCPAVRE
jgi:nitrogen fixation NifU-like protein